MASTLNQIQFQQVVDNLAMFKHNASSLPAQVRVQSGTVQVADQVSPSFSLTWPANVQATRGAGVSAARQWTEKWDVVPVTDPNDLRRLRALYRWAVGVIDYAQLKQTYDAINQEEGRVAAAAPVADDKSAKEKPPRPLVLPEERYMPRLLIGPQAQSKSDARGHYRRTKLFVGPPEELADFVLLILGATPEAKTSERLMMQQGVLLNPAL